MTEIDAGIRGAIDALREAMSQNRVLLIVTDSMARRGDIARAYITVDRAYKGNRFANSAFVRVLECIILESAVKDLKEPKPDLYYETNNR